jgi:hypothetical protein
MMRAKNTSIVIESFEDILRLCIVFCLKRKKIQVRMGEFNHQGF